MPRLQRIAPQFLVADLDRSVEFYTRDLGFELRIAHEDFYASVDRDGCEIHLKRATPDAAERLRRQRDQHLDAYFEVENLAALAAEFTERGVAFAQALTRHPWGWQDFHLHDPDGYVLCFAEGATGSAP